MARGAGLAMTTMQAKCLTIVGNGPLPVDAATRIDASDAVIRFNNPVHSPAIAGTRTDIFFVVNSGKSMQTRLEDSGFLTSPFFAVAKEIILPYDPEIIRKYHPKPNFLSRLKGRKADWTNETVKLFEAAGKTVTILSSSFYEECCEELTISKADRTHVFPSTGFMGIRYAMPQYPAPAWAIEIAGFAWQGWKRHDWTAEKDWVERYLANRRGGMFDVPDTESRNTGI